MPTSAIDSFKRLTFVYKELNDISLQLDVYPPAVSARPNSTDTKKCPAVVYFHGGGLTVGNKESWFPHWLYRRTTSAGCAFIAVDYRLIPPSNGHDILQDTKDAIQFVAQRLSALLQSRSNGLAEVNAPMFTVDPERIAVAGTSSGSLCAYLAALHAYPRPKAVLSMYGMGGNMLTPHYFAPKSEVFFRGRELLDPESFAEYLHPACEGLHVVSDSPLAYHLPTSPTPGYPANPRMQLARLYLQLGVFLDYYTGRHQPSLSAALREASLSSSRDPDSDESHASLLSSHVPPDLRHLFPQLLIPSSKSESFYWPPTFLIHGTADTALRADESRHLATLLQQAGIDVTIRLVEGKEHSFDYARDAEDTFGGEGELFAEAASFLIHHLGSPHGA